MNIRRFTGSTRRFHPKIQPKRPASTSRGHNLFQTWETSAILEKIDKPLDTISKIFRLFFYIAISLGVTLILIYCGRIEYFPSGLTLGDGFVFAGACLYFTLLYTLFTMFQLSAGLLIYFVLILVLTPFALIYLGCKKISKKSTTLSIKNIISPICRFDVFLFSLFGLLWIAIAVVPHLITDFDTGFRMLSSIVLMAFFCWAWCRNKRMNRIKCASNKQISTRVKILCLVGIIINPALISGYQGKLLDRAMTLMGVRSENVSVQLEESYTQLARQQGLVPLKINGDENYGYFPKCNLLLMGIGSNVVVEIKDVKLIVPSDKIIIAKMDKEGD